MSEEQDETLFLIAVAAFLVGVVGLVAKLLDPATPFGTLTTCIYLSNAIFSLKFWVDGRKGWSIVSLIPMVCILLLAAIG